MTDSADIFGALWAGLRPWAESIVVLRHGLRRHNALLADSLRTHCSRTLGWFLPLLGLYLALPLSGPATDLAWLPPLLVSLLIFGIGLLLVRLVKDHADWDGRVAEIVAFESRPTTLEIRALVSAGDSGAAWRLRGHVREGLVTFLQQNYPTALPRFRAEVESKSPAG